MLIRVTESHDDTLTRYESRLRTLCILKQHNYGFLRNIIENKHIKNDVSAQMPMSRLSGVLKQTKEQSSRVNIKRMLKDASLGCAISTPVLRQGPGKL